MAKKSVIERNKKRAKLVEKYAKKRAGLVAIMKDATVDPNEKMQAQIALQKMPRDSSKTRWCSRCYLTGRAHGVLREFGLSRIKLRELVMQGDIPGVTKSSW